MSFDDAADSAMRAHGQQVPAGAGPAAVAPAMISACTPPPATAPDKTSQREEVKQVSAMITEGASGHRAAARSASLISSDDSPSMPSR